MADQNAVHAHSRRIRERPSANLTAAETVLWIDTQGYRRATVYIRQTQNLALDAGDILDYFIDVAYNADGSFAVDSGNNTAAAITAKPRNTQDTISLDAVTGLEVGDEIRIEQEIMLITAISGTTLTVLRGWRSTDSPAHTSPQDVFKFDIRWVNVAAARYDTAATTDNGTQRALVVTVGEQAAGGGVVNSAELDLTPTKAGAVRAVPMGSRLRIRTAITNTPIYRYEAFADLFN